jgi:sporulation-control protein spo0M
MYVETEKSTYYLPSQLVQGCVHLYITKKIPDIDAISLQVKGKESFKYKPESKNEIMK